MSRYLTIWEEGKPMENELCRTPDEVDDLNEKLILYLRDLGHIMRLQYEGKASQKRILIILNEVGNVTQRDLTERLGIRPGTASEVIAKLENADLILRTKNRNDRRTTNIQLTEAGKKLASEAVEQRKKRHQEMFCGLSEEEKQSLAVLLEKLSADWEFRYHKHARDTQSADVPGDWDESSKRGA